MTGKDEATARQWRLCSPSKQTSPEASYSPTKLRDVEGNYQKTSYRQLLSDFPGIDWSTLFLLNGIPAFDSITVNQPEPIHEVERILAECPIDQLKAYLYFKVVDDAGSSLSDRFRQEVFDFDNHTMGRGSDSTVRVGSVPSVPEVHWVWR